MDTDDMRKIIDTISEAAGTARPMRQKSRAARERALREAFMGIVGQPFQDEQTQTNENASMGGASAGAFAAAPSGRRKARKEEVLASKHEVIDEEGEYCLYDRAGRKVFSTGSQSDMRDELDGISAGERGNYVVKKTPVSYGRKKPQLREYEQDVGGAGQMDMDQASSVADSVSSDLGYRPQVVQSIGGKYKLQGRPGDEQRISNIAISNLSNASKSAPPPDSSATGSSDSSATGAGADGTDDFSGNAVNQNTFDGAAAAANK